MDSIEEKLKRYIDQEEDQQDDSTDVGFDMMVDLMDSLDPDGLNEDQQILFGDILNLIGPPLYEEYSDDDDDEDEDEDDDDDDDESDEEDVSEKRIMKVKRKAHLAMKKNYRRNKSKFKKMNKMYRKTAAYKMWTKKHKRMVKAGRTRKKKYV